MAASMSLTVVVPGAGRGSGRGTWREAGCGMRRTAWRELEGPGYVPVPFRADGDVARSKRVGESVSATADPEPLESITRRVFCWDCILGCFSVPLNLPLACFARRLTDLVGRWPHRGIPVTTASGRPGTHVRFALCLKLELEPFRAFTGHRHLPAVHFRSCRSRVAKHPSRIIPFV